MQKFNFLNTKNAHLTHLTVDITCILWAFYSKIRCYANDLDLFFTKVKPYLPFYIPYIKVITQNIDKGISFIDISGTYSRFSKLVTLTYFSRSFEPFARRYARMSSETLLYRYSGSIWYMSSLDSRPVRKKHVCSPGNTTLLRK